MSAAGDPGWHADRLLPVPDLTGPDTSGVADTGLHWLFRGLAAGLRAMGPVRASNLGGAVARTLGPLLPVSRVADANLRRALPACDAAARRGIVRAVWDNLGRTVAELPHVAMLGPTEAGPGFELSLDPAARAVLTARQGAIFFTAHMANWEMLVRVSRELVPRFGLFYRAPRNRAADRLAKALRAEAGGAGLHQFPKGAAGARASLLYLRQRGVLGVLADQKLNDGIAVPFFGQAAMTSPAVASLALKFAMPVVPTRVVRLGAARFRVEIGAPLAFSPSGDRHADIAALTALVTARIEAWIRERPGEWLWLHRRWPQVTEHGT